MRKIISLALVGVLSLALVSPAFADRGYGGWRGGGHSRGWHGGGGHAGWWFPGALLGGLVVGSVIAATAPRVYSAPYAAPVYVAPPPTLYPQPQAYAAPVQRDICYPPSGCYHLYGDGVTVAYQWVWVPSPVVPAPPAPPSGPPQN